MSNNGNASESYWRALFQFAQSVGASDPVNQAATPSQFRQMSEADRQFLTDAMSAFAKETDPVLMMKENLKVLMEMDFHTNSEEELERGVRALENISDLCSFVDSAIDFYKIGGFRVLPALLASPHAQLRSEAANLIGELSQNNPFCQEKVKDAHLLDVLLELLDSDPETSVRVKGIFAIGCLVRHSQQLGLEEEFIAKDGLRHLIKALQSDAEKLIVKSSFLMAYLLENASCKEKASEAGCTEQLCSLAVNAEQLSDVALEHVLGSLAVLCRGCQRAQLICRREDLCLKPALEGILQNTASKPAKQEIWAHAQELIKLFDESSTSDTVQR